VASPKSIAVAPAGIAAEHRLDLSVRNDDYARRDDLPGDAVKEALGFQDVSLVLRQKRSGSQHEDGQKDDPQEFHNGFPLWIPGFE
jgi:hypothetical protein